jgi:NADH-quinone oxidoreductase subunit N
MTQNDLLIILPTAILVGWAVLLLVADLWIPKNRKGITALLAAFGLAISLGVSLALSGLSGQIQPGFSNMAVLDGFAAYADVIILGSGLLGVALAYDFLRRAGIERGEFYVLMLISTAGMMLMVTAFDLIVVFLALELLSVPLYVLAGFARPQGQSEEAALKYFLLGAFASAFFLYGAALIYGGTATTSLPGIVAAVKNGTANHPGLLLVGAAMLLVGLGFKVSAVPFHMWTPDVYQGSPSPVTAWMSVSVKVAGLAALLRVFIVAFPGLAADLHPVLWGLAALTMIVGNLLAIVQNNIKRLLAYSSIAHVGYLLMAFVPYGNGAVVGDAVAAVLFYLVGYGLTSFAAWGVVVAAEQLAVPSESRGLELDDLAGLGRKYPWLGVAMAAAMFSFTGIPLTLGFWGKFYVFQAVIKGGEIGLALIGLLTSLFSAYYYLRVLVVMFMRPGEPVARQDGWLNLVTVASAAAVVLLAFMPGTLFNMAAQAVLRIP